MLTVGSGTADTGVNWSRFLCQPAPRSNAWHCRHPVVYGDKDERRYDGGAADGR